MSPAMKTSEEVLKGDKGDNYVKQHQSPTRHSSLSITTLLRKPPGCDKTRNVMKVLFRNDFSCDSIKVHECRARALSRGTFLFYERIDNGYKSV